MGRYTEAVCKLCRREGDKLYLKGERCDSKKCSFEKRSYPPGQRAKSFNRKLSDYRDRLRESQKLKRIYGVREKPFRNYFERATRLSGKTGEDLLILLERRLDNVVYRLGFSHSRKAARQLVRHKGILVNGKRVDIPSYEVRKDDLVAVAKKNEKLVKGVLEVKGEKEAPEWLTLDDGKLEGRILEIPVRAQIDTLLQENLVVEFYS